MTQDRRQAAYRVRVDAAETARDRHHPNHEANGDEQRYSDANYLMSFSKGLEHDDDLGVVANRGHFEAFRTAIDEGFVEPFTTRVPVPDCEKEGRRKWEAPTAGVVFDLEGPDAQAVTMAPAPALCSDELTLEMAEVYELALLRDVPITSFDAGGGKDAGKIDAAIDRMNALPYVQNEFHERNCGARGRTRKTEMDAETGKCAITRQTAFRGSSPGVEIGPYVSQFLWIGGREQTGKDDLQNGRIPYGAQLIDQRVPVACEGDDYMQTWEAWRDVQDGCDVARGTPGQAFTGERRFICTPRDLATYVHFDALYQAYLNATLILLGMGTPFDPGFAQLSGMRDVFHPAAGGAIPQNAGGFALWGGPHILTLVTEVATRALKAVRFQKFNNHLRLRPEALAGRLTRAHELEEKFPVLCNALSKMKGDDELGPVLEAINDHNAGKDASLGSHNFLLPMAFAEGSPMHPTYGAGHATVAGACTTIVKAFFDTSTVLGRRAGDGAVGFYHDIQEPVYFEPDCGSKGGCGDTLETRTPECPLLLEHELNKLAANISIGRNMAGVHYYSDYSDSLRMGEEIAIGMLEEQALGYPTDRFVLSVPTYDGEVRRIGAR